MKFLHQLHKVESLQISLSGCELHQQTSPTQAGALPLKCPPHHQWWWKRSESLSLTWGFLPKCSSHRSLASISVVLEQNNVLTAVVSKRFLRTSSSELIQHSSSAWKLSRIKRLSWISSASWLSRGMFCFPIRIKILDKDFKYSLFSFSSRVKDKMSSSCSSPPPSAQEFWALLLFISLCFGSCSEVSSTGLLLLSCFSRVWLFVTP